LIQKEILITKHQDQPLNPTSFKSNHKTSKSQTIILRNGFHQVGSPSLSTETATNPHRRNTVNYVKESVAGAGSTASKEANKNVAKDSHAPLDTRAQAGFDAIGDKVDEQKHDRKADVHKEAAKH
jgi:hypothetical protein